MGFQIAVWGLFKKMVIADRLAAYVDGVYAHPDHYSGLAVLMASYFFAFQIYCDFSGYTDIAIGCAKMMGYDLRKNFDTPYFSVSLPEFWRRWHISLMSWFRDYLYFPLGGSRKGEARKHVNQLVVFLVSGLWHGANFTFIFWGLYHAILQIATNLTASMRRRAFAFLRMGPHTVRVLGIALTFHLVTFGWILFRASNMAHARQLIRRIPHDILDIATIFGPFDVREFVIALSSIGILLLVDSAQKSKRATKMIECSPALFKYSVYAILLVSLLLFGVFEEEPFLYFQF
jgi:D-alanyl-lipoteichoic acid acyltransferase DltB (MBOAT superfamily)